MFDFGKNKNKSKTADGNCQDYSWSQQDEAAGLVRNNSRESLKNLGSWSCVGIKPEMKDFVDLETAQVAAELAVLHPHLDVIESALKKFEDLRNGGHNGLSEDEKEIAEQKEREMRKVMTPLLNTLGQYESENKGEDPAITEGEVLR